jgi:hypothetical protein
MTEFKQSQVALVVVKVKVRGRPYFLMRKNKSWGDVTFIGGHVDHRDGGVFKRAAYRELLEEVPPLRAARSFELKPLTQPLNHGPVESPSAGTTVVYDLQFFLVVFRLTPDRLIASLGPRSLNVLVAQSELLQPHRYKVATLVEVLNSHYRDGLPAIPYSWPGDLESVESRVAQPALAFK